MKSGVIGLSIIIMCAFISACDNGWESNYYNGFNGAGQGDNGGGSSSGLADFDQLSSFTVEFNTESMTESETIPANSDQEFFNDYIENNFTVKYFTEIRFDGESDAVVTGVASGDTVTILDGNVLVHAHGKGMNLKISGSSGHGSLKIYSEKKFCLELNNVELTNPQGSAINIQDGNCFVVLNGNNVLADSNNAKYEHPEGEDEKAVFFSEKDLRFSGLGTLSICAYNTLSKECLFSDDAIFIRPNTNIQLVSDGNAGSGLKAKDGVIVKGGVLNVKASAPGKKGIASDGLIRIDGGRCTVITTGGVDATDSSDPSGCAALKCDSAVCVNGGEIFLKSTGQGGKGISADKLVNVNGGNLYIITEGSQYGSNGNGFNGGFNGGFGGRPGGWDDNNNTGNSVSPKGIRCDGPINILEGNTFVRTAGTNGEGIESKTILTFGGGNTAVRAYDDGFNASSINISGGKALAISWGDCDGIDSNGTITATGGVLIGVSSTMSSEDGVDCESTLTLDNATVIGFSAGGMDISRYNGHYVNTKISGQVGDYVALCDGATPLVTFSLPRTYSNGKLLISTPSLTAGTYSLISGVTPANGTLWMNYLENCTSVTGGTSTTVSAK